MSPADFVKEIFMTEEAKPSRPAVRGRPPKNRTDGMKQPTHVALSSEQLMYLQEAQTLFEQKFLLKVGRAAFITMLLKQYIGQNKKEAPEKRPAVTAAKHITPEYLAFFKGDKT
jgi:hypothetical protein